MRSRDSVMTFRMAGRGLDAGQLWIPRFVISEVVIIT
jgi:hypothetical protein